MDAKTSLGLYNAIAGMTYSEAAKYIEKLFKGRNDIASLETKKTMMSRLRNAQDAEKQKMQNTKQQAEQRLAYGGSTSGLPQGVATMADVKQYQKDYPEEMAMGRTVEMEHTKNETLADRISADHIKDLLTSKNTEKYYTGLKEAGLTDELAYGGKVNRQFVKGGLTGQELPSIENEEELNIDPWMSNTDYWGQSGKKVEQQYSNPTYEQTFDNIDLNTSGTDSFLGKAGNFLKENQTGIMGGVGLATSILGPMLANRAAKKNITRPDTINPSNINLGSVQPELVNRQQLERNLTNQASTSRQALNQMGLSQSQLAGGYGNIHRGSADALANTTLQANIADSQERIRVQQGRLGLQQYNNQEKYRAETENLANRAAYDNQMAAYTQAQGANIGSIGKSLFNYFQATNYAKEMGKAGILEATQKNV